MRRVGASEDQMLVVQGNLAMLYSNLGQEEKALEIERDVYSGYVRLLGEEHANTLGAGNNYASSLEQLNRFEEAKALLRKTMPVAQCVLGKSHELTLRMRWRYAVALYTDTGATFDDLREAVTTLEDTVRTARRVLDGSHPMVVGIGRELERSRAALAPCPRDAAAAECVNNQQRIVQCRGALSSYANSRRARRRRSAEA